jgi:vacuolar-type H+-ATPase subunit C/Vma6
MQKLEKISHSNLEEHEIALARNLVQHYRNAFDVRSQEIMTASVDPPEVRELVNMLQWLTGGFGIFDAAEHAIGLNEIIQEGAKEMEALISYVREFGATEPLVKEINYLQEQMEAADTLMGYLTNG